MSEEIDRLQTKPSLLALLTHYTNLAAPNRETWQDRVMTMEGVEPSELTKLHGELIAFSWIEQNTGNIPVVRPGGVPGCYRVTLAGLRAVKQPESDTAEEKPFKLRRRHDKTEAPESRAA